MKSSQSVSAEEEYTVSKGTFGSPVMHIEECDFDAIRSARECTLTMLQAEEKYDAIVENFLEFEETLLESTLKFMVVEDHDEDWFNKARNKFDRRIFNFLSTCRSYVEFAPHWAKTVANCKDEIDEEYSRLYDNHFAYRTMHAMRNYVTYGGNAAHLVKYSMGRNELDRGNFSLQYRAPELSLSVERIAAAKSKKISRDLLAELGEKGSSVNLVPLIREYLACISEAHCLLRDLCSMNVNEARTFIDSILDRFRKANPDDDFNGLVAYGPTKDGDKEKLWVIPPHRLDDFAKKNPQLTNLQNRFVTNDFPDYNSR